MGLLADAHDSGAVTVALASLNVLQTIALAYLAARSHLDRRNGNGADSPPAPNPSAG